MKQFFIFFLFLLSVLTLTAENSENLNQIIKKVLSLHPENYRFHQELKVIDQEVAAAKKWMYPMIGVEYSSMPIDSPVLGEHTMSGIQFKVSQTFPWPGKNELRTQTAQQSENIKKAAYDEWRNMMVFKVKKAYWTLAMIRQVKKQSEIHVSEISNMIDILSALLESAKVTQFNIIRLKTLKERIKDEIGELKEAEQKLTSVLNILLENDLNADIETPDYAEDGYEEISVKAIVEQARQTRPLLNMLRAKAEKENKMARMIDRERYPDITGWIGYRIRKETTMDPGTDFITMGVSIPLPFDYTNRFDSMKSAALFKSSATKAVIQSKLKDISLRVAGIRSQLERAREKYRTYKNVLIPESKRAYESGTKLYQTGKIAFEALFQTEVERIMFEKMKIKAQFTPIILSAEIDMLTGKGLVSREVTDEQ